MVRYRIALVGICGALYLISGKPAHAATAGSTPQATFDNIMAALAKQDLAGAASGLTDDTQSVFIGVFSALSPLPSAKGKTSSLADVLAKHGAKPISMNVRSETRGDRAKMITISRKGAENVKDKAACLSDAMTWWNENVGLNSTTDVTGSQLQDVKEDGDSATAGVKEKSGRVVPVKFEKIGGVWYLDISELLLK